jgi:hypothetical protein
MRPEWEIFNSHVSKGRIAIEHTIGMLKSKCQLLKGIRVCLDNTEALIKCITLIESCVIIHNLCRDEITSTSEENENNEEEVIGLTINDGDAFREELLERLLSTIQY